MRKTFLLYFILSVIILSLTFFVCILEAYGYEEGTLNTSSAQAKHEIIGYITYTGRYIGNNLFRDSIVFSSIMIQLAIIIDGLLISSIFTFIQLIVRKTKKQPLTARKKKWRRKANKGFAKMANSAWEKNPESQKLWKFEEFSS